LVVFSLMVNGARGSSLDVDAALDEFVSSLGAAPAPPVATRE